MTAVGLVSSIIMIFEDFLIFTAGKNNLPIVPIMILSTIVFYFYWGQIYHFTFSILRRLGII